VRGPGSGQHGRCQLTDCLELGVGRVKPYTLQVLHAFSNRSGMPAGSKLVGRQHSSNCMVGLTKRHDRPGHPRFMPVNSGVVMPLWLLFCVVR
jgi:hypothetical protein